MTFHLFTDCSGKDKYESSKRLQSKFVNVMLALAGIHF